MSGYKKQLNVVGNIKKRLREKIVNSIGWKTGRKIVVIESDDWGMIRMASKNAYDSFLKKGYRVDQCHFNRNDALESNCDLELLFEALCSVSDKNGNSPILTINHVTANPDFEKIRESEFEEYFYEPFTESLKRYPGRDRVIGLLKEGVKQKLVKPEFHCREHLNVRRWMEGLKNGDKKLINAFNHQMFTVHKKGASNCIRDHLDAFGFARNENEYTLADEIISSGTSLFSDFWGYVPNTFVAPCYIWSPDLEDILNKYGISTIQGTHVQLIPDYERKKKLKKRYHFMGQINRNGQLYTIRNVLFEPSVNPGHDFVSSAMNEINMAFRSGKPAVISCHRLNFIGSIHEKNRDDNLVKLKKLLGQIVKKWPDAEFMSSSELGKLIKNSMSKD